MCLNLIVNSRFTAAQQQTALELQTQTSLWLHQSHNDVDSFHMICLSDMSVCNIIIQAALCLAVGDLHSELLLLFFGVVRWSPHCPSFQFLCSLSQQITHWHTDPEPAAHCWNIQSYTEEGRRLWRRRTDSLCGTLTVCLQMTTIFHLQNKQFHRGKQINCSPF